MFKNYIYKKALKPLALLLMLAAFTGAFGQAAFYPFSQEQGAYTPLDAPTIIAQPTALTGTGAVDDNKYALPDGTIPFPFAFGGQNFTGLYVYANGFITLGATSISGNTPISTSSALDGAVAAAAADLHALYNIDGKTGDISYQTVGSAPNREFVIQWTHFRPYTTATSATSFFDWSFQIRLKEDNSISIVYDLKVTGTPTSSSVQVGLRGSAATDYNNRYSVTNWMSTAAGSYNGSTVSVNSTSLPPAGFTFKWTIPQACTVPAAQPTALAVTPQGVIMNGSFAAASPAADKYLVLRTPQGTQPNLPVDGTNYTVGNNTSLNAYVSYVGTATTFTDNSFSGILGNTNYTYTVYALNSACSGGTKYNTTAPLQANTTSCPAPINTISVTGTTTSSFDMTWTPNNGSALPLSYLIEVSTASDFATQITGSPFTVNEPANAYTVTALLPGTKYYFRMKAVTSCGQSVVSSVRNVTTDCLPSTSISENFDTTASDALPACWSKIIRGTGTGSATVGVNTLVGSSTPAAASIYNSSANVTTPGVDVILVTPQLTNLASGSYRLRFKAKKSSSGAIELQVGTLNDNSATGVFTMAGSAIALNTTYSEYIVYFSNVPATDLYIGFRKAGSSTSTSIHVDDVMWEPIPSCIAPIALAATNVTSEGATITWTDGTAGTPAGGYEYVVSETNAAPASNAAVTTTSLATVSLNSIPSNATRYVFVRRVCNDTDKSEWASVSFTTRIAAAFPWSESFATTATPAGWNVTGWTIDTKRGATGNVGFNIYKNLYGSSASGSFTTVNVGPLPAGAELSFDYKQSAYAPDYVPLADWGSFEVQVSTDWGTTWAPLASVNNEAGTGAYIAKTYSLAAYQGAYVSVKIVAARTAGDFDLSFDNFRIAMPALGTGEFTTTSFSIYPNPVNGIMNIATAKTVSSVKVFTLSGQAVGSYQAATVDLSSLSAGFYLVQVNFEDGTSGFKKIVKQ